MPFPQGSSLRTSLRQPASSKCRTCRMVAGSWLIAGRVALWRGVCLVWLTILAMLCMRTVKRIGRLCRACSCMLPRRRRRGMFEHQCGWHTHQMLKTMRPVMLSAAMQVQPACAGITVESRQCITGGSSSRSSLIRARRPCASRCLAYNMLAGTRCSQDRCCPHPHILLLQLSCNSSCLHVMESASLSYPGHR